MKKIIIYIFLGFFIAGCGTKTLPPLKKYVIEYDIPIKMAKINKKCGSLKIFMPQGPMEIMSKDIIYQKRLEKNSYYLSKWFETPNQMLYKLLFISIQRSKLCKNVYLQSDDVDADFVLKSYIVEFVQKITNDKSYIVVKINFVLYSKSGKILSQKLFVQNEKCSTIDAKGAVEAFDRAFKKIATKVLDWLTICIQSQRL